MATTPILIHDLPPGRTLTVDVYAAGSDTKSVTARALTAQTNRTSVYGCDITEALAGHYVCYVKNGGVVVAVRHCATLADDTNEYDFLPYSDAATVYGGINTVAGTITTLDTLDTAQDVEHDATQLAIANTLTTSDLTDIADAILTRDWTAVTGEAERSALNALRFLRNKWTVSGGTLSVKKEDDSTEAWNAVVSVNSTGVPIDGIDPT